MICFRVSLHLYVTPPSLPPKYAEQPFSSLVILKELYKIVAKTGTAITLKLLGYIPSPGIGDCQIGCRILHFFFSNMCVSAAVVTRAELATRMLQHY